MEKKPAYQMYAQDFRSLTTFFTFEQKGVLIELLNTCWTSNGLPADTTLLSMSLGISEIEFEKIWAVIKTCFFEKDGKYFNEMQEHTRAFFSKQSANGKKGGRPKKETQVKPKLNPNNKPNKSLLYEDEDEYEIEEEIENENENENEKKEKIEKSKKNKLLEIVEIFNSDCVNLPSVQKITPKRESVIHARISDYDFETVEKVIRIASKNDFLNGKNERGWKADFDWIMNPNNFIKILEGKYQENKNKPSFATNR